MRTLAPTAATEPQVRAATDPAVGGRTDPTVRPHIDSQVRARSRQEALRLAREARVLPEDLRWFYLRALRSRARRDEPQLLAQGEHPFDLAALLDATDGRLVTFSSRDELEDLVEKLRIAGGSVRVYPGHRLRLPALGLLIGTVVAVLLPPSLTDSGPGLSGSARTGAWTAPAGPLPPAGEPVGERRADDGQAGESEAGNRRAGESPAGDGQAGEKRAGGGPAGRRRARALSGLVRQPGLSRPSGDARQPARRRSSNGLRFPARAITTGAFSGTGDRKLGTLRVDRPVTLRWTAGDASFTVVSDAWRFRPQRQSDTTVLTPGAYRGFTVRATARWKLTLSPTEAQTRNGLE